MTNESESSEGWLNPRVILAMTPSMIIIGHVGPGCTSLIQKCGRITIKGAPRVQSLPGKVNVHT